MRLALAGDAMFGRKVAERLRTPDTPLFAEEVLVTARSADLFLLNLECCISERGERWPDARKRFFFRAPPAAVNHLHDLGVDAVTLANNHALDYGTVGLLDTLDHLEAGGVEAVGAGPDRAAARRPLRLTVDGHTVDLVAVADHPADFAATADRPGIAYADLHRGTPAWLTEAIAGSDAQIVIVAVHWGPNMTVAPLQRVRDAADALVDAGATVVAGHSAHVFHGVRTEPGRIVCYDLGDFIDDYAVDPALRNDLGLLWFVEFDAATPVHVEALPLRLDYCFTRPAVGREHAWVVQRLTEASAVFGTDVHEEGGRLVMSVQ